MMYQIDGSLASYRGRIRSQSTPTSEPSGTPCTAAYLSLAKRYSPTNLYHYQRMSMGMQGLLAR